MASQLERRVAALEQSIEEAASTDPLEMLSHGEFVQRFFRGPVDAPPPSPLEEAVHLLRRVDIGAELLAAPDTGSGPNRRILERLAMNVARRYLAGLRSLDEPDLPFAEVIAGPPHYDKPHWAWRHQQDRREVAAEYLAAVELARGVYTPKAWPLQGPTA